MTLPKHNNPSHSSRQLAGSVTIMKAIENGAIPSLVLMAEDAPLAHLTARLDEMGVEYVRTTRKDIWRMARSSHVQDALALVGRQVHSKATSLMMECGPVWLLSGVSYPSNVGTIIRGVEVAGAAGIVIDGEFNRPARLRAKRVAMRADRFLSVLWQPSVDTVAAARNAGRQVVAIESTGSTYPWELDLTRPSLFVVGGERHGIPEDVLSVADEVVRLPCPGFIPSWNVQAAVAAVSMEYLRQSVGAITSPA